jgi:hypothetical protein
MRYLLAAQLLLVAVPMGISQCSEPDSTPVIQEVSFPTEITGNGVDNRGYFTWTDDNAGVQYAISAVVVCPEGFECTGGTYDLTESDAEYTTYTSGRVNFTSSCTNNTGVDVVFSWTWQLLDVEGHYSNAEEYSFTCLTLEPPSGVMAGDNRISFSIEPAE